jgi:hypothetical protein
MGLCTRGWKRLWGKCKDVVMYDIGFGCYIGGVCNGWRDGSMSAFEGCAVADSELMKGQ